MQHSLHQLYVLLIIALLSLCAVMQLREVAHLIPPAWSDLYPQWRASQAAIHHEDPYSTSVTHEIQIGFYGRVLGPDELWEPQNFNYPGHLVLFLAPFTFLPWMVVRLAFAVAGPFVVGGTLWIWLDIAGLQLSAARRTLLYGLVLTSWPAIWAYQLQQPTIFVFGAISLAIFCFAQQHDAIAGALFATTTVKPNLVLLVLIWLLLVALLNRRWKFIASFAVTFCALIAASELIVPGWIGEWAHVASMYTHHPLRLSPLQYLFGPRIGLVITGVLLLTAALQLAFNKPGLLASAALLLSVTACIVPTTRWMVYNNLLLIPAALLLITVCPKNSLDRVLRFCARSALIWFALAAPLAVLVLTLTRAHLRMLPFCEFTAVFCITLSMIVLTNRRTIIDLAPTDPMDAERQCAG